MANELNFWKRLQGNTPLFFKRVINVAMTFAGMATAILTAPIVIPDFVLPVLLTKVCQYAIAAGLAAAAVGKTTVKDAPNEK